MPDRVFKLKVLAAFAAIYLFWGSTFLAIRFALYAFPPLFLAGARHFSAGVLLYSFARARGAPRPAPRYWPVAALIGGLMLVMGNGGVVLAEQRGTTGIVALMIATVPLWIVALDWLWKGAARPTPRMTFGLVLGIIGIGVLAPTGSRGAIDHIGLAIVLVAAFCWATGSLLSRDMTLPSGLVGVSMEMLSGGAILLGLSAVRGEWSQLHVSTLAIRPLVGLGYLVVCGSLAGFTAYNWLLAHVPAAKAATYAFVNPVIAVALGWLVLDEPFTLKLALGSLAILGAVVLIVTAHRADLAAPKLAAPGTALTPREAET